MGGGAGGTTSTTGGPPAALELIGVAKTFPGVAALAGVSLALQPGEVHCLLGENGAGKTTLASIVGGLVRPDAGRILASGVAVAIDSPRRALALGIGLVHQHSTLVPTLTVLENLLLAGGGRLQLDRRAARARLATLTATLEAELDPDVPAGALALGERQLAEIVKALWRSPRVLVLDEPTSMLTPQGAAGLARTLAGLKEAGLAVLLITHKLHEAIELGDRLTVLRRGRVAGTLGPETLRAASPEALRARIVGLMFGDEATGLGDVAELAAWVREHETPRAPAEAPLLELVRVSAAGPEGRRGVEEVTLAVHAGEIVGVAGMDGNGQRELAEAIAGQRPLTGGEIRLGGRPISRLGVSERQRLGLRYVTDDRLGEGTVGSLPIALNLALKEIGERPGWRAGFLDRRSLGARAAALCAQLDVRATSLWARVATLSGGNVQKVVLARELAPGARVVVYNKPTQGLDVRTTRTVRARIREQAAAGTGALLVSPDLEELLDLADRVYVLSRGRIRGVVENGPGAAARIGELMAGER